MQDGIVCLQIWQNPSLRHSFEDLDGVYPFLMPRARYNHRCTGDDIGPWFLLPLRSRNFIEGFQHVLDISTIPIQTTVFNLSAGKWQYIKFPSFIQQSHSPLPVSGCLICADCCVQGHLVHVQPLQLHVCQEF